MSTLSVLNHNTLQILKEFIHKIVDNFGGNGLLSRNERSASQEQ